MEHSKDRHDIYQTALDYVEGQYEGDAARVERSVHPQLAKRAVLFDERRLHDRLEEIGALELVQQTRLGALAATPREHQIKEVQILDVYQNIASVRVESHVGVDYLHFKPLQWALAGDECTLGVQKLNDRICPD